jgi:hypothetical protein
MHTELEEEQLKFITDSVLEFMNDNYFVKDLKTLTIKTNNKIIWQYS